MSKQKRAYTHIPTSNEIDVYYDEYSSPEVGGTHDRETFGKNMQVFFDLTFAAYVVGTGSRKAAWKKLVGHLGDQEAHRYFTAVDNTHPYT
jgi:hypothetical protein